MKIVSGEIKDIFNKLIKPSGTVSPEISGITGITPEMLEGCAGINDVLGEFISFIGRETLIAHNTEFDLTFIKDKASKFLGKTVDNPSVCTLELSRALLPNLENHKLHTIASYFKVPISARHRAIGDVEATYQIWLKMVDKLKGKNIHTIDELRSFLKQHSANRTPF